MALAVSERGPEGVGALPIHLTGWGAPWRQRERSGGARPGAEAVPAASSLRPKDRQARAVIMAISSRMLATIFGAATGAQAAIGDCSAAEIIAADSVP
jgi:hypothetical protein